MHRCITRTGAESNQVGGARGARHLCRFSVGRAGLVRMRCDVRTVKRRERRAPSAAWGPRRLQFFQSPREAPAADLCGGGTLTAAAKAATVRASCWGRTGFD